MKRIKDSNFYIEFEYIKPNQKQNANNIFSFSDLVYQNENLETAVLQLTANGKPFPPPIQVFESIDYDKGSVYLIGHPNGAVLMDDSKIEFSEPTSNEVRNSIEWASRKLHKDCRYAYMELIILIKYYFTVLRNTGLLMKIFRGKCIEFQKEKKIRKSQLYSIALVKLCTVWAIMTKTFKVKV